MQSMNMQNPRKILVEDALAMIFIDFGLLRSPYCKMSHLLADIKIRVKIWQPTYDWVCEDNGWIHGQMSATFLSNVYKRFFYILTFFCFFDVFFLIFIWTFITSVERVRIKSKVYSKFTNKSVTFWRVKILSYDLLCKTSIINLSSGVWASTSAPCEYSTDTGVSANSVCQFRVNCWALGMERRLGYISPHYFDNWLHQAVITSKILLKKFQNIYANFAQYF